MSASWVTQDEEVTFVLKEYADWIQRIPGYHWDLHDYQSEGEGDVPDMRHEPDVARWKTVLGWVAELERGRADFTRADFARRVREQA